MKVAELIEMLAKLPPDADIKVCAPDGSPEFDWLPRAEAFIDKDEPVLTYNLCGVE